MLEITLQLGDKVLASYETCNDDITIGRSAGNDIRVDNLSVSGNHARVRKVMNTYLIEDLGSTNGTFVNEKRIERYELIDGDRVIIGKHSLLFHISTDINAAAEFDADKTMILDTRKQRELLDKNR